VLARRREIQIPMDSEMFQVIFWSSIVLALGMGAAVMTVMGIDPSKDALLYNEDPLIQRPSF
jgi:hypothetical protein